MIRKKDLMKRIIYPVMEEMGFVLAKQDRDSWEWKKEVDGIEDIVTFYDFDHRVSFSIGKRIGDASPIRGEDLLQTLEQPRTTEWDWSDKERPGDRRERYEDILLDFRDILLKNCDTVLKEHAEKLKKLVPNRKHFEYMCSHREELIEEYGRKLGIDGSQNIIESFDMILEKIRERIGKPLEEVERDLIGYAVLLESEILRLYGGVRGVNEEFGSVVLSEVGKKRDIINILTRIFWVWKDGEVPENERAEIRQEEIRRLYEDNLS